MNDPARQASPLLTRLASKPVVSTLLRSTLSGLSQVASNHTDNLSSNVSTSISLTGDSANNNSTSQSGIIGDDSLQSSFDYRDTNQISSTPARSITVPTVPQSQSVVSITPAEDLVDDDAKLALFDSVLDELRPQTSTDTIPSSSVGVQSMTTSQPNYVDATTIIDESPNGILKQVKDDGLVNASKSLLTSTQPSPKTDSIEIASPQPDPLVSMMSQSMPSDQFLPDTLNMSTTPSSSGRTPESVPASVTTAEVPGITIVEHEPNNFEIPVEVEGFLERVANHADKLPQEIVIQGDSIAFNQVQPIKKAVIVLPISEEDQKKSRGKNPTWAITWLINWSQKIIKKFTGKVVYQTPSKQLINP